MTGYPVFFFFRIVDINTRLFCISSLPKQHCTNPKRENLVFMIFLIFLFNRFSTSSKFVCSTKKLFYIMIVLPYDCSTFCHSTFCTGTKFNPSVKRLRSTTSNKNMLQQVCIRVKKQEPKCWMGFRPCHGRGLDISIYIIYIARPIMQWYPYAFLESCKLFLISFLKVRYYSFTSRFYCLSKSSIFTLPSLGLC